MINKKCEICGKEYITEKSEVRKLKAGGRYCSDECCWESMRKPEYYKKCPVCGERFYAKRKQREQIHCSIECARKNRTPWGRVNKKCEVCGKKFWVHKAEDKRGRGKYCSKECAYKAQKTGMVVVCSCCGNSFYAPGHKLERCIAFG
jgi:hypothetical protein